ncbi:MAG TPA: sigma 54-interacting transcriptional regulator [Blastocatellia bacterium]|nr:sigma 54-interacting transcriptional regulator [Blastocatellia bacterium]
MEKARHLLLDFHPTENLACLLRGILESHAPAGSEFQQVSIASHEPGFNDGDFHAMVGRYNPDVIFVVFSQSTLKPARTLIRALRRQSIQALIIIVTEVDKPEVMVDLLQLGASDFITLPLKAIDVLPRIWRLLEQRCQEHTLTVTLKKRQGLKQLVGESPAFVTELKKISLIAKCDATILIAGETGTGKELCARSIHYLSARASQPFTPVNCGAIPVELMENELFGHERGAFTGAATAQPGLIHESDSGTLFLDEIDCLPLLAQVKVLRFLQEKEYRPLGSTRVRQADVRVIAATNADLKEAVKAGRLREDLYYRLNIIPIVLPALRERRPDIPLLARHFLAKYAAEFDKPVSDFSPDAMENLMLYEWPGNVRELEHVVERATLLAERATIRSPDLLLPGKKSGPRPGSFQEDKARMIAQFERTYIEELLKTYQGNITRAAQAAQKNRRAFWQLIRKHRIDPQSYRPGAS